MSLPRRSAVFGGTLFVSGVLSCSVSTPVGDGSVFPAGIGVMIVESTYDGQSIVEAVDSSTHVRALQTGVGYDADPHLRKLLGADGRARYFLVGSTNGTVSELDAHGVVMQVISARDDAKGTASNPQDVALMSDGTLLVTRGKLSSLLFLHPDGARETADLASFADPDGNPDADAVTIVGESAFVTLRRLGDGFDILPAFPSILVAVDLAKPHATRKIAELPPDPFGPIRKRPGGPDGELWITSIAGPISTPPTHGAALVRVDASTGAVVRVLDEANVHGFVDAFDLRSEHEGYAIVASFEGANPTHLVAFDPATGVLRWSLAPRAEYVLWDVQARGDLLFVTDRTKETPNLALLRTSDGAPVAQFATRTLPIDFVLLGDSQSR